MPRRADQASKCTMSLASWTIPGIISADSMCADAERIARFVKANLWDGQRQRLLRSYLNGPSDVEGYADDYAYLISGLLDLHSVTGETQWLAFAQQLQQTQDELFWDETAGKLLVDQVPMMLLMLPIILAQQLQQKQESCLGT